jgi:hypothetical protein
MSRKNSKDLIVMVEIRMPMTKFVAVGGSGGSPSFPAAPKFRGSDYAEAFRQARAMGWGQSQINKAEKGFLTRDGQFLSKKTATRLAIETGQFGAAIIKELEAGRSLSDKDLPRY